VIITMVVVLAGAGVAVAVVVPLRHRAKPGPVDNAAGTSLATVARQTLTSQTSVSGTLGYAGTYDVINQARGTLTAAPAIGQVIHQGQVLYRVDGKPVVLLYGSTPAYRVLAEGATASDVSGPDVRQLNHDLVALGYASKADLDPDSDEFSWATKAAVEKLQDDLDVDETGSLALGQIVFLPAAIRITSVVATVGGQAGSGPLLKATSTARQVIVALDLQGRSIGRRIGLWRIGLWRIRLGLRIILRQSLPARNSQIEHETEIADFDTAFHIFGSLGFTPSLIYEKQRRTWRLNDVEVVLDKLPFGLFMEIEGTVDGIKKAENLLRRENLETVHETYPQLTVKFGKLNGKTIEARFEK